MVGPRLKSSFFAALSSSGLCDEMVRSGVGKVKQAASVPVAVSIKLWS